MKVSFQKNNLRYLFIGIFLAYLLFTSTDTPDNLLPNDAPGDTQNSVASLTVTLSPTSYRSVQFIRAIDGDTIELIIQGTKEKVRIIGIDTPESVDPRRPVECFGKEASKKITELLTSDQKIELISDPSQSDRDRYNRLLRYVLVNGEDIGKLMISEGFAHEYTYDTPYMYQSAYTQAEIDARDRQKGMWADSAC